MFLPKAKKLPVHCTEETERDVVMMGETVANRLFTQEVYNMSACPCIWHIFSADCTSVPVGDDILEADKHLSIHVQFIDCRVDGISTRSVTLVSVSIGNNQEDSAASLKHFPVCGAECLG